MSGENAKFQGVERSELVKLIVEAVTPLVQHQVDSTQSLISAVHGMQTEQRVTNERLERISVLADRHEHILRGNGSAGLMTRIIQVESEQRDHGDQLESVIVTLRGDEDRPGLVGRVTQLEAKTEGIAKPLWIVLSALLSTGVTLIISNLVK